MGYVPLTKVDIFVVVANKNYSRVEMFLFESTNQNQISITGLFEPCVFELQTRREILVTKIFLGSGD